MEMILENGQNNGHNRPNLNDKCPGCTGIESCTQEIVGMVPVEEECRGYTYTVLHMCWYEQRRRGQNKIRHLFRDAKIPEKYAECGFDDYHVNADNQSAVKKAHEIVAGGSGAIFHGNRGSGKTMLASIIANEMTKKGCPVLFTSVPELFDSIRARFKDGSAKDIVDGVKDADFLILDDMGAEKMTDWVSEQLFIIINHRYNMGLPLVITTNYDPKIFAGSLCVARKDGLDKMPAERIMSRLREMCSFVHVGGGDWRM